MDFTKEKLSRLNKYRIKLERLTMEQNTIKARGALQRAARFDTLIYKVKRNIENTERILKM